MVKYFFTFPYALLIGLNSTQATIAVTIGGMSGFIVFYYFWGYIIKFFMKYHDVIVKFIKKCFPFKFPDFIKRFFQKRPVFSKQSRWFIKLKNQYGFWGLIITTPLILSVPLGAFLLNKYYSKHRNVFIYMMGSFLLWTLIFLFITFAFPNYIK